MGNNTKDKLNEYWVLSINRLLKKFDLETIKPAEFTTLIVQTNKEAFNFTVICTNKMLVVNLNQTTQKITGGWKHF